MQALNIKRLVPKPSQAAMGHQQTRRLVLRGPSRQAQRRAGAARLIASQHAVQD